MAAIATAILAPVLTELAKNGLGLLAGAIQAKGKEVIEKKLGVEIPANPGGLTAEKLTELKKLEFEHEEFLINAQLEEKKIDADLEKTGSQEATKRWQADMASDSWLSKNVRPLGLLWVFFLITVMVVCDAAKVEFQDTTIDLVQYIAAIIVGSYFIGRTAEKGLHIFKKAKK